MVDLPPASYRLGPAAGTGGDARARRLGPLHAAIRTAPPGSVIHLASGNYPRLRTSAIRTGWVTISGAGDRTPPVIDGAVIEGARFLRFVDVKFTRKVAIIRDPYVKAVQPSENIQILNSEIDCGAGDTITHPTTGVFVRGAAENILLSGDYVHNCVVGFASVAQDAVSSHITIAHSTFEDFSGDAVDLGGLSGVVIDHDIIRDIGHSAGVFHDDAIQFLGNVHHVQITNDVLANSQGQLIFIQDAVKSLITGSSVNDDILVAHNLIYGAGAYAVQTQGALNTRFIANTMWSNHFGSLLLRRSGYTGLAPADTVVYGNIIEGLGLDGVRPAYQDYNLLTGVPGHRLKRKHLRAAHDLFFANPRFVDAAAGDFQLTAGSPARGAADRADYLRFAAGVANLSSDLYGLAHPPKGRLAIGALQAADPRTAFGAPIFGPRPLR